MISEFAIRANGEFSFQEALCFLKRSDLEPCFNVERNCVRRLFSFGSKQVLLDLREEDPGTLTGLLLEGRLGEGERKFLEKYLRQWFDLDRDLGGFYKIANQDKTVHFLQHSYPGLRLICMPDLFECISWAILGQQINIQFAYQLKQRLTHNLGEVLIYDGKEYFCFPRAEVVASSHIEELRKWKISTRKAEYLIQVARLIAEGKLSKGILMGMGSREEQKSVLCGIRGIGPWTAEYVLLKCLGDISAFPFQDVGIHNALKGILNREEKPSITEIKNMAINWDPWQGYVAFYLWRHLVV